MREIKFRAWDKENTCWFEPIYEAYKGQLEDLNIGLAGDLNLRRLDATHHESTFPGRFTLMQYTGLKDKNGKEIYEGDILRYVPLPEHDDGSLCNELYVVKWLVYGFGAEWINPRSSSAASDPVQSLLNVDKDMQIIGSIQENPELLHDN